MEPRIQVVFRIRPACFQLPRHGVLVEVLDPDGEVIHQACGTPVVQRDEHLRPHSQAHDFVGLVFTHGRQSEHLLIKSDGTRQIADLDAHVVNLRGFNDRGRSLRLGCPARRGQHRKTLN